jgi:hypothetical protein
VPNPRDVSCVQWGKTKTTAVVTELRLCNALRNNTRWFKYDRDKLCLFLHTNQSRSYLNHLVYGFIPGLMIKAFWDITLYQLLIVYWHYVLKVFCFDCLEYGYNNPPNISVTTNRHGVMANSDHQWYEDLKSRTSDLVNLYKFKYFLKGKRIWGHYSHRKMIIYIPPPVRCTQWGCSADFTVAFYSFSAVLQTKSNIGILSDKR